MIFTKTKHTLTYIHQHYMQNVAIPDSGCTHDMSSNIAMFESVTIFKYTENDTSVVKLMDDNTMLRIQGYGCMDYKIMEERVSCMGYYVPNLGATLISVRQYIKYKNCYFHMENNKCVNKIFGFHFNSHNWRRNYSSNIIL